MKFERIRCDGVPELGTESLSNCKKMGNQVFISGMVSWDADQNIIGGNDAYRQAQTIFSYIRSLMEAAGGAMDDVIKINMYVTDMRYQPDIWKARREFFTGDFPCSTLVCVSSLFLPELLVEIEAVGFIGAG